jgi:hypothetical protein
VLTANALRNCRNTLRFICAIKLPPGKKARNENNPVETGLLDLTSVEPAHDEPIQQGQINTPVSYHEDGCR